LWARAAHSRRIFLEAGDGFGHGDGGRAGGDDIFSGGASAAQIFVRRVLQPLVGV